MKRRQDHILSLTCCRAILWGTAPILLLAFTGIGAAQPATIPRQNEMVASAAGGEQNTFLNSMKEMRQRAQTRYNQNMQQWNEQMQRNQQKMQAQQQAAAKSLNKSGSANKHQPVTPNGYPQAQNYQKQAGGNPLSALQQLFGSFDNSGAKSGFPQQAQNQPRSGFAPQQTTPQAQQMASHQHNHNGQNAQMTAQQQQQAWLMQQRMQAQAAAQQARTAASPAKAPRLRRCPADGEVRKGRLVRFGRSARQSLDFTGERFGSHLAGPVESHLSGRA